VEGSTLEVDFQLNKPVRKAVLVAKNGREVPLSVEAGKPGAKLTGFSVVETATYEVKLEDEDGRASKVPAQFTIEAKANRKPELKFLAPRGDIRVSPIEEVGFRVEAWDDFGLQRVGLQYTVAASNESKEIILAENTAADARITAEHLLQLEKLNLEPDELISWFAWAEDIGPDGKTRRTVSDMYFAEVRPFEEIFRQGDSSEAQQQQQRQQSQAGNQATKLAELQKQIMSATWNLQRAEGVAEPVSEKYRKDEPVIRESQEDALEQTKALAEKLEDPKSRAFGETAAAAMQKALDQLTAAAETGKPLPEALKAEQSAYNALLKLASHEYNVTRRQQSKSGREQASRGMQQQLDELELKKEENRYETQREAASPEEQEQREQLAVLNRLKELAQRQQDINEKVKELQAALQEEKTEAKKEELQRELKRLREEQQQMLADLDELRSKTEEEKNQSRFAEERQGIERARNEAQQASEALQRGEASQALANGSRAQQGLQEMRDELRRKTSKRFTNEMRNMRTEARELADRQKEVAESLNTAAAKPERRTLDGSSEKEKATQQLEKQKGDLQKLTADMKTVSEQAEASEPLLATELYDTLRKSAQADTARSLEMTRQLAQRGYAQEAQKFEEKARGEIEAIKEGVERAAEKVLGDEAEALRKARADLDQLTKQVDREISNRTGEPSAQEANGQTGGQAFGEPQPGQERSKQNEASPNANRQARGGRQPGEEQNREGQGSAGAGQREPKEGETPGESAANKQQGDRETAQRGGNQPGNQQGRGKAGQREDQSQTPGETSQPGEGNQPGEEPRQEPGKQQTAQTGQRGQGQRPSQQPGGNQAGKEGQPGGQPGNQPGSQSGQPSGEAGQNTAQANPGGQQDGSGTTQGGDGASAKEPSGNTQRGNRSERTSANRLREIANAPRQRMGPRQGGGNGGPWGGGADNGEQAGPLTGEDFVQWSDQLRAVEEMLDDPNLRAEAARIREVAKGMRAEFKRHSVDPKWEMVRSQIRTPLAQLRDHVAEELARREKKDALVPIDRDPVPTKFAEQVRKYYENLGRSTP
jgi:hypothetical protein